MNMELTTIEHQRGKKRKREVENWLRNVRRKKTSVEQLEEEVNESNCLTQLRLGRLVEKNIQEVAELVEQGRFPEGLSIHLDQSRGAELLTSPLVGQNAQRSLQQMWNCLIDVGTSSVGVYGMGGVGKTEIVTHIHNLTLDNARSFDYVYWVSVGTAKEARIDLFGEEDEMRRAARLFKFLKRRRIFLLILDDVWEAFSLEKVGIPLNFGGKLIITTRLLKVCRGLDCQQLFKIDPLSMEESWDPFTKKLKSQRVIALELERVMRFVAKDVVVCL
ncbi:hypothetical protein K2173_010732 [Erythroxylum novogranatense]|uniref:NB-ARC domain-containing protein n=1 Tax=Erythroxylum novogranatense TaxID=1862640 RepID=A0AAV8SQT6_9ROSI|nr:hypothetical protein K2173_010732 [Erythroxylum novogranatense]